MATELALDLWNAAAEGLCRKFGEDLYERWLAGLTVLSCDGEGISLGVPNRWVQGWIEARYIAGIREVVSGLAGRVIDVRLAIDPELFRRNREEQQEVFRPVEPDAPQRPAEVGQARSAPSPAAPDSSSSPFRLEDFVVGSANELAYGAALRICEEPGVLYNPFYIHGSSGVGKTHLLRGLCARLSQGDRSRRDGKGRGLEVRYLRAERFYQHFAACAQDNTLRKFRERHRSLDVLIIDDVQDLASKTKTQQELLFTVEALVDAGKQVIVAADAAPRSVAVLDSGLAGRFLGGLVARLKRPDFLTRLEIVCKHARRLAAARRHGPAGRACGLRGGERQGGVELRDEVLELLAENLRGSVHELLGGLLKLDVHARVLGRSPTADEALSVLVDLLHAGHRRISVESIQREVGAYFGIPREVLVSTSRERAVAYARHVAIYLSRRFSRKSFADIGRSFGSRSRATVRAAEEKIARLLESPQSVEARDVGAIIGRLEE